jgi:hypothetical protein
MTIETVLYGKRALVRNEKELKMHLRKQELVAAMASMRGQTISRVISDKIMGEIISINRKIERTGAYVQFLD